METTGTENQKIIGKKQYKQLKSAIYTILISLIIIASGFGIMFKMYSDENVQKDLKISTLIGEVGEIKAELNNSRKITSFLLNEINDTKSILENINSSVIKSAKEKEIAWKNLESELNEARNKLNAVLLEKENIINSLASKNEAMSKEMNIVGQDPAVLDVLILGHNANLVDTIILASANPKTREITLISIPRDLYHKGRKINELYKAYGIEELNKAIYEITGVFPDKYILFDLYSFVQFIDALGGINIEVKRDLIDYAYPAENNSYIVVSFKAGEQLMDGKTSLKYARSRKSTSDFDRSLRQQQVIIAVKNKVLDLDLLSKLDIATRIYGLVSENIVSDISLFDALGYLQNYKGYDIDSENVIDTTNFLYSTSNAKGQYILLPVGDSYYGIKKYIADLISN